MFGIDLCKYRYALGVPGQGIHSYRFMGVAIADVIMTILGAIVIAWIFGWNVWLTMIGFFALGIVMHHMFCVKTTMDTLLFGQ